MKLARERLAPIFERAITHAAERRPGGGQIAASWRDHFVRRYEIASLTMLEREAIYDDIVCAARELRVATAHDQLELIAIAGDIRDGRADL